MSEKKEKAQLNRAPVVVILGHVDHGKTTILDKIRQANVAEGEIGGITQKISVFTVDTDGEGQKNITFIDTPGHEAFDLMRSRGGNIADVALLIVAADDSVMPQTKESIEIINRSKAKPIIVINKCDLPDIDIPKIKRDLANNGMIPEDMGGKVPVVQVSGKTGKGIDELLETINVVIEIEGLQQREPLPDSIIGRGVVLESVKDPSKGYVSSAVVLQGDINRGDLIVYKTAGKIQCERIKGFIAEDKKNIEALKSGYGGKIIGLSGILDLGSDVLTIDPKVKKDYEKMYKDFDKVVLAEVAAANPEAETGEEVSQNDLLAQFFGASAGEQPGQNKKKTLNIILKSSSEGSLEAIVKSLARIKSEEVTLVTISKEVGDISQKDIDMAAASKAIVLGFEVHKEAGITDIAAKRKVLVRSYDIIYKLIEELQETVEMLEGGQEIEEEIGNADVKQIFTLSNGTKVIGCRVAKGYLKRGEKCYIVRGDDIVSKGKILSMKHQKSEINESKVGDDCGLIIEPTPEVQEGDKVYCFKVIK